MSDAQLEALATAAGFSVHWTDADGRPQQVAPDSLRALLEALGYPAQSEQQIAGSLAHLQARHEAATLPRLLTLDQGQPLALDAHARPGAAFRVQLEDGGVVDGHLDDQARLPALTAWGYHQLHLGDQAVTLAVAPPACPSVAQLSDHRRRHIWGLAAQLYGLRRPGDGGLGDTQALEELVRSAAAQGADAIALSPVHAMFSADLQRYSPYSPSSRLLFNVLHAAPASILGDRAWREAVLATGLGPELQRLESLPLVDWPAASAARLQLLRQLYQGFAAGENLHSVDFDSFCQHAGDALLQHCRFEALHGFMSRSGLPTDWRTWPEPYRDPASPAVLRFAEEHADEVRFHAFAQWLVARGLDRAQSAARGAGMAVGLIADLAVGADGAGSQAWARQAELLPSLTVGAPPDILNRSGQAWGISAFSPDGLRQQGFRAFIEMLRANLAHAGGLRIDHVMGLQRLWVLPEGADPRHGAYLNYPREDLLRLLCLEATRHRALIVGEDLGTVPEGLREALGRRLILGMRVLLFEQADGRFTPPDAWPADALATTTTHDLPTLRGWLAGRDIHWREAAGQTRPEQAEADREHRQRERQALESALHASGQRHGQAPEDDLDAAIAFIGRTPAPLVLLPLEDAVGSEEQPNLPGPGDLHPNWRRRWPEAAASLLERPEVSARLQRLDHTRRQQEHPHD
ncbi:4-alpha-glucanotransferase [Pseudomonas sp. SLBN-26]|uniref:4-alpha-glucanotransferase n=1 Tax=Pseudomonadaceae TaxID=135621 RepID=UPI00115386DE|nr:MULTISPECIES: 4-alpha-glucanotransferase [Pseudomonas]MCP1616353.1 4-alpha-glucanotransferase [Pseudomonas otitidis]TQL05610.1 4-alpha-glucanotransferase [Pseudomonas sp. SLBN-26]